MGGAKPLDRRRIQRLAELSELLAGEETLPVPRGTLKRFMPRQRCCPDGRQPQASASRNMCPRTSTARLATVGISCRPV